MANFNFGIDCPSSEDAEALRAHIENMNIYQQEMETCDERVSLVSKQTLLDEIKQYAKNNSLTLSVEIWPEGEDYDEAESSGSLEFYTVD